MNAKHFARCNLSWFKDNMIRNYGPPPAYGNKQSWTVLETDSIGPTQIRVDRGIAKRVEFWYRISIEGKDSVFEKRLEYPEGADNEIFNQAVSSGLN